LDVENNRHSTRNDAPETEAICQAEDQLKAGLGCKANRSMNSSNPSAL
jgi:hypothetical protein